MTEPRGSRRELALVACALLLPIPLLAASGLGIPLPSSVERGLASLLALSGDQEASVRTPESGAAATTDDSTGGPPATEGPAAVPGPEGVLPPGNPLSLGDQEDPSGTESGSGGGTSSGESDEDTGSPTSDDAPPDDAPAPDADEPPASEPRDTGPIEAPRRNVAVGAAGAGASAGAAVGEAGVSVDVSLGDGAVGVTVDTPVDEVSLPDVDVALPTPRLGLP